MAGVTYTERTVNAAGWNPGHPAPGGLHYKLFGAIVLYQPAFYSSSDTFVERTVTASSFTEKTVSASAYTERSV
jgi:hypothetical protein